MVVPACHLRDELVTHRTKAILLPPKIQQGPPAPQGICHLHAQTGFEVGFPRGVVGIGLRFDFDMPFDWRVCQSNQPVFLGFALTRCRAVEDPMVVGNGGEIFPAYPSWRFVRVPTLGPAPQGLEDRMIHLGKGHFTHHMAVIIGPPAKQRVELANPDSTQFSGAEFPPRTDTLPRSGFAG